MTRKIRGRVLDSDGEPESGLLVQAFDDDPEVLANRDDRLESARTSEDGKFEIEYTEDLYREWFELFESGPDIYLLVRGPGGEILHTTDVRRNASKIEEFQIELEGRGVRHPVDPYSGNLERLIAAYNDIFGTVDPNSVPAVELAELLLRSLSRWTYYTQPFAWDEVGYDGPQVPTYPRDAEHDHEVPWYQPKEGD